MGTSCYRNYRLSNVSICMRVARRVFYLGLGAAVIGLAGCSHGSASSYSYYTGKKNPRIERKQASQQKTDRKATTGNQKKRHHIVRKGETLYSIAWQYGYDVREIARWNRIWAPYTIYPQQKIVLSAPKSNTTNKPKNRQGKKSAKTTAYQTKTPSSSPKTTKKINWQWPTKGKIISRYSARDSGKKGVDIAGRKGQRIYAASGGQIVYSGSGLRGYGKLIIIKHNDTYFSAYAHNNRLLVKEQQLVKKGQHIADMGSSEASRAMLHFEVRRNGKPVDPLRYLPKRR